MDRAEADVRGPESLQPAIELGLTVDLGGEVDREMELDSEELRCLGKEQALLAIKLAVAQAKQPNADAVASADAAGALRGRDRRKGRGGTWRRTRRGYGCL